MKIITTTYKGPDLDGYGCSIAYAELLRTQGKDAEAYIWGVPHLEVQWLIEEFTLPRASAPISDTDVQVVLIDASEVGDLPGELMADQVIEIIDHRKINEAEKFQNAKVQIELVGAAATLIAERFKLAGINPLKESSLYLLGGIISNTQNFTAVTTDRDRKMASWLQELSCAPSDIAQKMFIAKSNLKGDKPQKTLFGDLKLMDIQSHRVAIGQLELIGVEDLVYNRRDEIESFLSEVKNKNNSEYTFVNMKDLDFGVSFILCLDKKTQELLGDAPGIEWSDDALGISSDFTLRKQMSAWIDEELKK